jgi:thiol-disulfide isomerase/thioredoxin
MKRTFLSLLLVILGLAVLGVGVVSAQDADTPQPVTMYLFWGDGCPHCAEMKPYLDTLLDKYPGLKMEQFEVWYNDGNANLLKQTADKFGFEVGGVPTLFIGPYHFTGYGEQMNADIEGVIEACRAQGCPDSLGDPITPLEVGQPLPNSGAAAAPEDAAKEHNLTIPLLGTVDLDRQSLFASTVLIAVVDGINPCSVWVLSMLLALTVHTGSRRKVLIIGLIFLTVTAAIYALFIAGLFSVLKVVSFMGWIRVVVALVAGFFALVNIKDYFWYKEGLSFTIDDKEKPGIAARMRRVVNASESFPAMAGATVVLAAGVSLVEFSCTAGFPVLWTNMLTSAGVGGATFVALLLTYMLIYQLDELVLFGAAVITLRTSRLEEKHGRILKLIGGMLLLTLALVMVINPALMNTLSSSLWIFGGAFAATGLVLLVHRVILPEMGVHVGTENKTKARRKTKPRRTS